MDTWNPSQYDLFKKERSQPGRDLIALLEPSPGGRALDLGCGTGELTSQLHRHLQTAETLGIDRSARMLHTAQQHVAPGLRFELGDILNLPSEPKYDVIFSNAALHWLPEHPALFEFLTSRLAPQGQLAVQVPTMESHPVHRVAKEVAREPRFAAALKGFVHQLDLPSAEVYAEMLWRLGYSRQNVRLQIYAHVLPGPESAVEWIKGTLLTAYQEKLDAATFAEFLAEYSQRLLAKLPAERPCFFPYQRILIWGRRG